MQLLFHTAKRQCKVAESRRASDTHKALDGTRRQSMVTLLLHLTVVVVRS